MGEKARRVLIVGGGYDGWLVAAYLDAALNRDGVRRVDVSLVESADMPRIDAAEVTTPSIQHIFDVVGLDEREFLGRVDGTFRQAAKFVNWLDNSGESYYHPFNRFRESPVDTTARRWLRSDRSVPFAETVSVQPALCEENLAPKPKRPGEFGGSLSYGYHLDAIEFGDYLRDAAIARGVERHTKAAIDVELNENGDIAAVRTEDGQRFEADLFIDCTGFRAQLIGKALNVGWEDCSEWLLCDRAVVMPVGYDTHYPGFVRPCTVATALSSGWAWDIPLQNRREIGYVYSSQFIDRDAAEQELRALEGTHAGELDTRLLEFRVGMRQQAWKNNCIAVGPAGGYFEPLESTGIYLVELAAVMLAQHFPETDEIDGIRYRFNRIMADRHHEILDFINVHYALTRRSDTAFWREVGSPTRVTPRLRAKLDYWRLKPPSSSAFVDMRPPGELAGQPTMGEPDHDPRPPIDTGDLFDLDGYEYVLYGMDFLRDECDTWFGADRPRSRIAPAVARRLAAARGALAPHDRWMRRALGVQPGPR